MAVTEDFYYVEGNTSVKNLVKTLVKEITQNAGIYKWDLVVPASIDDIGSNGTPKTINLITDGSTTSVVPTTIEVPQQNDTCILKTSTSYGKTFYVKIERTSRELTKAENAIVQTFANEHKFFNGSVTVDRTDAQVLELLYGKNSTNGFTNQYEEYVAALSVSQALNNIRFQICDSLNSGGTDINIDSKIQKEYNFRLAWYRNLPSTIKDWLPVQYWISMTKDAINLVLRGDPSADVAPYKNYLASYAYIGGLKPVEDSAFTDDIYNFGITTSSDIEPNYSNLYGERTATGVTDVCMIANKIGMPYQPHYPAFYATNPFIDKCNVEGSRWDHKKHQFSDITVVHPVDMERGKMINVLVGDASSIFDGDKLIYMKDTDSEENYKKFKVTAPFNFLNNSANINYCIAIRCYKTSE